MAAVGVPLAGADATPTAIGRRRRDWLLTLLLLAAQGVVGILQYQLELPSEIVWVHVALATLTWVGFVHARAAAGRLSEALGNRVAEA